jgi:serine/threonine protein kinase
LKTIIGKYEIIEELGQGGFGIVYKVRDTLLEVDRALKVLHPVLATDPTFLARFKQEAQLAAKLEAPNLVPVYNFGEDDGRFYLVMKYMPGGSLKDLLEKNGCLDEKQALAIFEEAGRGVDFAHSHGVIHRDLKPSNILFDSDGTVRISDMGFAKFLFGDSSSSMSTSGGMVGTPAYMAPEIWRGKPATPASDIYSMGCILYEMLTGKILFDGDSPADVMTKHVLDGPLMNDELSEPVKRAIGKALTKNPEDRYPSMLEFTKALKSSMAKAEIHGIEEMEIPKATVSTLEENPSSQRHVTNSQEHPPKLTYPIKKNQKKLWIELGAVAVIGFLVWIVGTASGWFSPQTIPTVAASLVTKTALNSANLLLNPTPSPTSLNFLTVTSQHSTSTSVPILDNYGLLPGQSRLYISWREDPKYDPLNFNQNYVSIYLHEYGQSTNNDRRISSLGNCRSFAWSPDGSKIAYIKQLDDISLGKLTITDRENNNPITKWNNIVFEANGDLSWFPDNRRIAFHNSSPSAIAVLDTLSEQVQILIYLDKWSGEFLSVSPDGSKIAFMTDENGNGNPLNWTVTILDINTKTTYQVGSTQDDVVEIPPYLWSQDSKYLLFNRGPATDNSFTLTNDLWSVNANGTTIESADGNWEIIDQEFYPNNRTVTKETFQAPTIQ